MAVLRNEAPQSTNALQGGDYPIQSQIIEPDRQSVANSPIVDRLKIAVCMVCRHFRIVDGMATCPHHGGTWGQYNGRGKPSVIIQNPEPTEEHWCSEYERK